MGEIPSRVRIPLSPPEHAPVAQLDRVSGYEPEGRRFESFRARHIQEKNQQQKSLRNTGQYTNVLGPEGFEPKEVRQNASEEHKVRRVFWTRFSAPRRGEKGTK